MATKTQLKPAVSVLLAFALTVAACGGAAKPEPAMAPSNGGASSEQDAQPSTESAAPAQPSSPEAAPPTAGAATTDHHSSSDSSGARDAELRGARHDVQLATRDLDSSMGDCANVCRALMSLERATSHLCGLAVADSDRSACDNARTRVQRAQAQIKASCGTCANGASLDSK